MIGIAGVVVWLFSFVDPAPAQQRASRALRAVEIERTAEGWDLVLDFEFPIRYLRHTPENSGRTLQIVLEILPIGNDLMLQGPIRESLPIPRRRPNPVRQIVYDSLVADRPILEIQFDEWLDFDVKQDEGLRRLRIQAQKPTSSPTETRTTGSTFDRERVSTVRAPWKSTVAEATDRASRLLSRARRAIRDGNLDLGIALLTRVTELPEDEVPLQARMDAREWIGLTHERSGQRAHAEAEYEAYLVDYPEGAAATRVRQRLNALRTADVAPRKRALRSPKKSTSVSEADRVRREIFGSIAVRYFRSESLRDDSGGKFLATDVLTDVDIAGQLDTDRWALRGDLTGTYDVDVAGQGRSDDARISRLSMDIEDRAHGIEATLGRQRRSDSGVLGRFDGLRVAADLGSHWGLSALVGMPVTSTSDRSPDTDTLLAGGAIDMHGVGWSGLEGQFFAVGRHTASMTDRAAIGGELRYAGEKSYSFSYFDYDVEFDALNTFLVSSTYRYSPDTDFRILIDRRSAPILTLGSALQGQNVDSLKDLKKTFSEHQIRELALDRTAVSWSGSVGATHRTSERLQISTDLTLRHTSGTGSSSGVSGNDSTGPDFAASFQLLASDFWIEDGVGSFSFQYFEGDSFRSLMFSTYTRFTFLENLRLLSRIRWQWRDSRLQGSQSLLRPSLELDWRAGSLLFNAEAGLGWTEPISDGNAFREVNYFLETGIRWEF